MKPHLFSVALSFTLGAGLALAQAPIVRQSPDQTAAPLQQPTGDTAMSAHAHRPHNPQKQAAHVAQQLNLTGDQQTRLAAAFADRDQKMSALRQNTALDPQDMRKQAHAISKSSQVQIAGILTPDQMQQFRAMRKQKDHMRNGQNQPMQPEPNA